MISRSNNHWYKYIVPALFACLVIFPVLYYGLNSELARWKAARAQLYYDQADFDRSIELMEQAVAKAPHNQTLKLNLATKLMMHERAGEALEIIETVIPASTDKRPAIEAKSNCLMFLGRKVESLQTYKKTLSHLSPEEFKKPLRLNQLAYFQALAGKELDDASENIESSIEMLEKAFLEMDDPPMSLEDQTIIAAAIIANELEKAEYVLPVLSSRIDKSESSLRTAQQIVSRNTYELITSNFPFAKQQQNEIREGQFTIEVFRKMLALLLSVRALVYQGVGEEELCDLDRLRVEELGHNADSLVSRLPGDWYLMSVMENAAQFLDTRAMVTQAMVTQAKVTQAMVTRGTVATRVMSTKEKRTKLRQAVRQLDISVLAFELLSMTADGALQNTIRDEKGNFFNSDRLEQQEAILRKHRSEINLQLGQTEKSQLDIERIKELGVDPDKFRF